MDSYSIPRPLKRIVSGTLLKNGTPVTPRSTLVSGETLTWTSPPNTHRTLAAFSLSLSDGVNIAARLEPLAEPGGIALSARIREDAADKLSLDVEDLGTPGRGRITLCDWFGQTFQANLLQVHGDCIVDHS